MKFNFLFLGMNHGVSQKSGKHYCIVNACWTDCQEPAMVRLFVSDLDLEHDLETVALGTQFSVSCRSVRGDGDSIMFFC